MSTFLRAYLSSNWYTRLVRAAAVTYAFALYGTGRVGEGIEVLKRLAPEQLRDPHAAVYAALLFQADKQTAMADQYLALARRGDLFPEEKELLEEIRKQRVSAVSQTSEPKLSPNPR